MTLRVALNAAEVAARTRFDLNKFKFRELKCKSTKAHPK